MTTHDLDLTHAPSGLFWDGDAVSGNYSKDQHIWGAQYWRNLTEADKAEFYAIYLAKHRDSETTLPALSFADYWTHSAFQSAAAKYHDL